MRAHVQCGADNLRLVWDKLAGKRLGLMTHPCGYDAHLVSTIDLLHQNGRLCALFGCEHGLRGAAQAGAAVSDEIDAETGVPIFSLFGDIHAPTPEMLDEIDVMVVDLQDVGSRFYTYVYSMCYTIEACARAGKPVVVLDRINPLSGLNAQGTILDERFHSFVGEYAVPTRHALTIGEFARQRPAASVRTSADEAKSVPPAILGQKRLFTGETHYDFCRQVSLAPRLQG